MHQCASWPPYLNNDELRERIMGKQVVELSEEYNLQTIVDELQEQLSKPVIELEEPEESIELEEAISNFQTAEAFVQQATLPRLCKENAAYWRAYESPHIGWMQEHIDDLKKRIMREYNNTSLLHVHLQNIPSANDCLMGTVETKFSLANKKRQLNDWKKEREEYLDASARFVRLQCHDSNMRLLVSVPLAAYKSRGAAMAVYACGQLIPYINRLEGSGFTTHHECKDARFVLWANIHEWMFDALCRRLTVGEARKVFQAEHLDPNAYVSINHEGHYLRSTCNI